MRKTAAQHEGHGRAQRASQRQRSPLAIVFAAAPNFTSDADDAARVALISTEGLCGGPAASVHHSPAIVTRGREIVRSKMTP